MMITDQTFEVKVVTVGAGVMLMMLSFLIGFLVGQENHPDSRILNKKEWPCSMPIIKNGEPECTEYERAYIEGKK